MFPRLNIKAMKAEIFRSGRLLSSWRGRCVHGAQEGKVPSRRENRHRRDEAERTNIFILGCRN